MGVAAVKSHMRKLQVFRPNHHSYLPASLLAHQYRPDKMSTGQVQMYAHQDLFNLVSMLAFK